MMILRTRGLDRVDGPLAKERILDWMLRSGIKPDVIDQARQVLPDSFHPDRHDHLLAPFGFDRAARAQRISTDRWTLIVVDPLWDNDVRGNPVTASPKGNSTSRSGSTPGASTAQDDIDETGVPPEPIPDFESQPPGARTPGIGGAVQMPRQEVLSFMRRAGYTPDQIQEVQALLPEQVDSQEHHLVLEKYGLDTAARMERMGSSP
jgi:hypothetical protein